MVRRIATLTAVILAFLATLAVVSPASAHSLFDQSCSLASNTPLTLAEARVSGEWHCPAQRSDMKTRHAWVRIPPAEMPPGSIDLQSDSMASDGMTVATIGRDGKVHATHYTPSAIAHHWIAGTRFSIPLPLETKDIDSIYMRIDNPIGPQVATSMSVAPRDTVAPERLVLSVMLAFLTGMVAIVAIHSLVMSIAMRSRFAFYNFTGLGMLMIYTISSSSLIFLIFPNLELWPRTTISYAAVAISISMLGPFMLNFLEPGMITPRMRRLIVLTASIAFAASLIAPLAWLTGWSLRGIYHLLFVPGIVVGTITIREAWRKGSVMARAFTYAWIAPTLVAVERIARAFNLSPLDYTADTAFYIAMAGEGIAMSIAIAWRFNSVKHERDEALRRGSELAEVASRDSLTGLFNRRDFDSRRWRKSDVLAIVDLDRFKTINDRHGHLVGDEVLRAVGKALADCVSAGQILRAWRLGGEEFAVAIDAASIDDAAIALNVVRERIAAEARSSVPQVQETITASAGMASIGKEGMRQAYRTADAALYHAKTSGRDRLCYDVGSHTMATIFPRPRAAA